ncbi:unnamed protein product [Lactuca saligna]|uniref:Uncharacterized protein n=1 Tax=Lactuca saligna TaxID=75948 RepID=A0AA36EJK3_LACSI|nr:unnamed protein product [Lactuca saligna]
MDYQDRSKRKSDNTLEVVWQDDVLLFDYNVQERVNDFVAAAMAPDGRVNYEHYVVMSCVIGWIKIRGK